MRAIFKDINWFLVIGVVVIAIVVSHLFTDRKMSSPDWNRSCTHEFNSIFEGMPVPPQMQRLGWPQTVHTRTCAYGEPSTSFSASALIANYIFMALCITLIAVLWNWWKVKAVQKRGWLHATVSIYALLNACRYLLLYFHENVYYHPTASTLSILLMEAVLLSPMIFYVYFNQKKSKLKN